jgi:lipopolysaccharide biosynthesis regulator YciM
MLKFREHSRGYDSLLNTNHGVMAMYEDRSKHALATWHKLLERPEIRMTAQEQYEELLRLAEEYLKQGFIDREERKRLVIEATQRYAKAVEGVGEGT